MKWVFDLDGTVCHTFKKNDKWDYENAIPRYGVIEKINKLYNEGHYITIFTARGSTTGIDWEMSTKRQLKKWDVSYNELIFGKPSADVYVDDRTLSPEYMLNNWNLIEGLIGKYQ